MEMWLRVSTLLFLTAAGARLSQHTDVFLSDTENSTQQTVEVPAGSSLTLYCCLNTSERQFWINWDVNPYEPSSSQSRNLSKRLFKECTRNCSNAAALSGKECKGTDKNFNLTNVNRTNSGSYTCLVTVNIPSFSQRKSHPTQVIVTTSLKESTTYPSLVTSRQVEPTDSSGQIVWRVWIIIGGSSAFLIVLLVVCLLKKRGCHRKRAAEPVYANTPIRQPSPQPKVAMNNLKAASVYQNIRTPGAARRTNEDKRGCR